MPRYEPSLLMFQLYLIVQWVFLSSTIILFNKHLLSSRKFHFPITLVIMHMLFVSACSHLWRYMGWTEAPSISWRDVLTRFAPIAAFFAMSLGFGNAAYLYISVAFVQMLKASTPVAVLLCSFAFGLEAPNASLFGYICIIAAGVSIAAYGQLQLNWTGVCLQLAAVVVEALRLCLVNIALTARGIKLPSVTFLSVVAPLCAVILLPVRPTLRRRRRRYRRCLRGLFRRR
jgi:drug/metabolite transporter (DMT)-like permease